jgi:PAS domain-containing protein
MQATWESLTADLSDLQLVQQERSFLDIVTFYQQYVLDSISLPMCLLRRVGEIYVANDAWASALGLSRDIFEDGRVCLYQWVLAHRAKESGKTFSSATRRG